MSNYARVEQFTSRIVSFNPSVGILFCRTVAGGAHDLRGILFQSLGRDSVLSNYGILETRIYGGKVSIPRSGFCFVEPHQYQVFEPRYARFNPSVGILFCRTRPANGRLNALSWFQSLGRDSVLSNASGSVAVGIEEWFQSLGRDSVLSNAGTNQGRPHKEAVSIPRSGFCFVEPCHREAVPHGNDSFNPSVGILFC